ncbi:MAG: glutamine amidotransferase class-i [Parcubacteria group bacterium GW2011_GWA2_49_9]|nr:MAG: glutamine amidotransferase class-i [Parcubacteria group bacterium GW2011_GWA2_49_9]
MKILIFQHVPHESPGYIADYAKEKGITLTVLELWKPYTMPEAASYDALIVLGGPMGVYDDFPSKEDELRVIRDTMGKKPLLGICLGSQLLARTLGAKVYKNFKDGKRAKEIGYYDVTLTKEGSESPLFKDFTSSFKVLQWHGDAFDLPPHQSAEDWCGGVPQGATLLASSPLCDNQAFLYKSAYGTLFHTEFTVDMVKNLADIDRAWTHEDFNLDEQKLLAEAESLAPLMKKQCYRLLDNFLVKAK